MNAPETVLPVHLHADIKVSFDDGTENTFTETENGTILSMHGISLPPYYFLTAANLKYSYSGSVANSAFEVCTVKDTAQKAASDGLPVKKSTLIAAEKNVVSKTDKVYTQVKELDVGKINGDDIALGFLPVSSDNGVSVYADGVNAAVLSLKYVVNVGLNPDAVTEPFESDCVTSYVNVYTQKLTSVIDFMTVNSNVMPIQLQMVYNQTYDTYKNDLCTANKNYILTGFGKNFKLNLEQYCYRYDFDGNGTYDGAVYIDGSGAVHQFKKTVRSDSGGLHYVCDDCNLTCVILDNSRFTIYKNDYPYMYFANNRLQWIATSNKCLRVSYESANGKYRIKKVYNCLEGGTYDYPSSTEAQSVTFSYNSDNLLTSVTSNYGESVSFTYDANQQLTKVSRGSLPLATVSYDSAGKITKVIGKQKTGYSFKYWRDDQVRYVYNVTTNGYVSDTGKVMFNDEGTTKSVYRDTAGLQQIAYSYGFNSSAKCESAYKGYYMYRDERSPRSSVTIYSKQESNKVRTNTALSYTEDFTQLNNATFESLTGKSPTEWTVNTANEGSNYTQNSYGYALSLSRGFVCVAEL